MSNLGSQKGSAIGTVLGLAAAYFTDGASLAAGAGIGGAVGGGAGALLQKPPALPVIPATVAQPDRSQIDQATQLSIASQLGRRGRASTILTPPSADKLGD